MCRRGVGPGGPTPMMLMTLMMSALCRRCVDGNFHHCKSREVKIEGVANVWLALISYRIGYSYTGGMTIQVLITEMFAQSYSMRPRYDDLPLAHWLHSSWYSRIDSFQFLGITTRDGCHFITHV